jgi:polyvinyl alcohol dehydrogenase (cytochrome)
MSGNKDGMFYGLNPDTGEVLWKTRVGRGGELGGVEWGFSTDQRNAYVPVVDATVQITDGALNWKADGSLTAVNVETGEVVWKVSGVPGDCEGKPTPPCTNAFTLPTTVAGNFVFAGMVDGVLRVFDTATGKQVWKYDTVRKYNGVNGRTGWGGTLAAFGGPVVAGNGLYIMSGMDQFNIGLPGNVVLAFEIPD